MDMNSTFVRTDSRTEQNNSQRKRSVLSNGKSESGLVLYPFIYI